MESMTKPAWFAPDDVTGHPDDVTGHPDDLTGHPDDLTGHGNDPDRMAA
jgi:hypothetical protein